jgi:hypothetical protein
MTFPLLAAEKKSTFFIIVHRFWQRQPKTLGYNASNEFFTK